MPPPRRDRDLRLLATAAAVVASGCAERPSVPALETTSQAVSIDDTARVTCGTPDELVLGLSRQLVAAINCLRPGTLVEIPLDGEIRMLEANRPNLIDGRALADLRAAAADGDRPMVIRWAYRDVGLQQLFWLQDQYQGCALAARPGNSNHQNGLAVDLNDWEAWEPVMRRHGWANDIANDRVHFDYGRAEDIGLASLSLYAFQELWNVNHPEAPVPLSGALDEATFEALASAPLDGFERDLCENGVPPEDRDETLGRAAWRACAPPAGLRDGLSAQVADSMSCLQPGALAVLGTCAEAGCIDLREPEAPARLETATADALRRAGLDHGAPLPLRWAFRDPALDHFLALAAERLDCPPAPGAGRGDLATGLAVEAADDTPEEALTRAGFSREGTDGPRTWRRAGDDLSHLGVLAFQRLWNLNHPEAPLDEDGLIGPLTRGAIERAPVAGFGEVPCPAPPDLADAGADRDAGGPGQDAGPSPLDAAAVAPDALPTAPDAGANPPKDAGLSNDSRVLPADMALAPADGTPAVAEAGAGRVQAAHASGGCTQAPPGANGGPVLLAAAGALLVGRRRRRR